MSELWERLEKQLRTAAPNMTPTLAQTALWVANHLPDVAWRTVDEIAAAANVSPASVVRCLQQVGYKGYNAFRQNVRQGLPSSQLVWELTREHVELNSSVPRQVVQQEQENLARLEASIEPVIMELVGDIAKCRTVVFTGSITSRPLAAFAAAELNVLLGNVRFLDAASSDAWLYVRDASPEDLVVGISFPRYAHSTLELLRKLEQKVSRVWLVTDEIGPRSFQERHLVRLPIASYGVFQSKASVVLLIQILARMLAEKAPDTVLRKAHAAEEAWREAGLVTMYMPQADLRTRR
jgi:DNA-binding MurR/RpiR family transcriptional regulator